MSRRIKELMVQELTERFQDIPQTGCVLLDYTGMDAEQATEARQRMAEQNARLTVVKNSVFSHALENLNASNLSSLIDGPTAVVTAEDPVVAAKMAKELSEQSETIAVRGGYVDGNVVNPDKVEWLSDLPDRDTLLAQVLGGMSAPLRGFANGLQSLLRNFASCVDQLREKREEEAG